MDTTIDEVAIEIGSNSSSASKGLDALTSSIEKLFKNLDTGLSKLNDFNSKISDLKNKVSGINFDNSSISKIGSSFKELSNISKGTNLKSTTDQLKEIPAISRKIDTKPFSALQNSINKVKSSFTSLKKNTAKSNKESLIDSIFGKLASITKIGVITAGIQKLGSVIGGFVSESSDYIEALNLFNVTFGEMSGKAKEFVNNFTDVLGVDPKNVMQYMSTFYNLADGFGLASDKAYLMSENLTQLSYDLSSFWNISQDEAMQKLKSGLAGEIEPMRAIGVALDQATLQELAYSLGINKRVAEMTRAEKAELLYYQIMQKTTNAQGDMARTLLQPQNALRVLKNQFTQLARAIGNIFIPILMAIIPYIKVVVQWLTILANKIAALFGFKIADYVPNTGAISSGLGDISTGLDGVADSASNANKELNYMLGKFDELNVIDFDKATGGSGGSGVGAGASGGDLGLELPTYNALENALSKNLEDVEKKLKNILPYVETIGIIFASWKIGSSIVKFLNSLGLIKNLKSALRVTSGISLALGGAWLIYKGIKQAIDEGGLTPESLLNIISGGLLVGAGASLAFKNTTPLRIASGLSLAIGTAMLEYNGIKKVLDGDLSTETIIELLGGSIGAGASTYLLTRNIKLSLIISAFAFAFNLGTMIGEWINKNYGDRYDYYLKVFNVHLEDGIDITDILGMMTTALATIGDVILDGFKKIWDMTPDWVKTIFRIALNVLTFGVSETIINLVTSWNEVIETIKGIGGNIVQGFKDGIGEGFKGIGNWIWETFVSPFIENVKQLFGINSPSTVMIEIGQFIVEGFLEGIKDIAIRTSERFEELKNTVIEKVTNIREEIVNKFEELKNIVTEKVTTTRDNVINKFNEIKTSISNTISNIKDNISNKFEEIKNRATEKITNMKDSIKNKFEDLKRGISDIVNSIKDNISNKLSNINIKMKLPHFSWSSTPASGWIQKTLSALNLPTSLPKLNVNWYAEGGFPDKGELFFANEAGPELVGNIGNRAAVANNDQIIQGIAEASYQGVSQALAENRGNERQPVNVYIGNKKIYSGFGRQINSDNNMYGTNTVKV